MEFTLEDIEVIRKGFSEESIETVKSFGEAQGILTHYMLCDIWEMLHLLTSRNNQGNDCQDCGDCSKDNGND